MKLAKGEKERLGEELDRPAYAAADRIAVVGIVLQR